MITTTRLSVSSRLQSLFRFVSLVQWANLIFSRLPAVASGSWMPGHVSCQVEESCQTLAMPGIREVWEGISSRQGTGWWEKMLALRFTQTKLSYARLAIWFTSPLFVHVGCTNLNDLNDCCLERWTGRPPFNLVLIPHGCPGFCGGEGCWYLDNLHKAWRYLSVSHLQSETPLQRLTQDEIRLYENVLFFLFLGHFVHRRFVWWHRGSLPHRVSGHLKAFNLQRPFMRNQIGKWPHIQHVQTQ